MRSSALIAARSHDAIAAARRVVGRRHGRGGASCVGVGRAPSWWWSSWMVVVVTCRSPSSGTEREHGPEPQLGRLADEVGGPCRGSSTPGRSTTMLPPWRVISGSATPRLSTRLRMMSTATSIDPASGFADGLEHHRDAALEVEAEDRLRSPTRASRRRAPTTTPRKMKSLARRRPTLMTRCRRPRRRRRLAASSVDFVDLSTSSSSTSSSVVVFVVGASATDLGRDRAAGDLHDDAGGDLDLEGLVVDRERPCRRSPPLVTISSPTSTALRSWRRTIDWRRCGRTIRK